MERTLREWAEIITRMQDVVGCTIDVVYISRYYDGWIRCDRVERTFKNLAIQCENVKVTLSITIEYNTIYVKEINY